ncbi:MAG: hypothetical protein HZB29_09995 [Nitrospinae bacterium]|nr:hypothetical protein [Nitrospinota bacterium]
MNIKRYLTTAALACVFFTTGATAQDMPMGDHKHHHMMDGPGMARPDDRRVTLKTPAMMREHLKQNMREHLKTVNETLIKLGAGDFSGASAVLHERLGVTEEMKRMCGMFGDETYRKMGIALHEDADETAKVIATGDMKKSVVAVGTLLNRCVACHEMFKVE